MIQQMHSRDDAFVLSFSLNCTFCLYKLENRSLWISEFNIILGQSKALHWMPCWMSSSSISVVAALNIWWVHWTHKSRISMVLSGLQINLSFHKYMLTFRKIITPTKSVVPMSTLCTMSETISLFLSFVPSNDWININNIAWITSQLYSIIHCMPFWKKFVSYVICRRQSFAELDPYSLQSSVL